MQIPLIKPELPTLEKVSARFDEILSNGKVTNFGKYVQEFEKKCSQYLGVECVAVASGTQALSFSFRAMLGEIPGKVIVPSFTFMATGQVVPVWRGQPLFVEIGNDYNICLEDLEDLLDKNSDVVAVVGVNTFGMPAHVEEVQDLVNKYSQRYSRKVPLLWDSAHAFGASVNGKKIGNFGDVEAFSFSITKPLVCGEGGMVASHNSKIIEQVKVIRNYGVKSGYNSIMPGANGKMSEFHAIIGLANLENYPQRLEQRIALAEKYVKLVESATPCRCTSTPAGVVSTWKQFSVLLPKEFKGRRDAVIQRLAQNGIETRAYFYPPLHMQTYFKKFQTRSLEKTEDVAYRCITLPFFNSMSDEQMNYVVGQLAKAIKSL